jgi:hypothetical protein
MGKISTYLLNKPVLLDGRDPLELFRPHVDLVHRTTATGDVVHHDVCFRKLLQQQPTQPLLAFSGLRLRAVTDSLERLNHERFN